MAIQAEAGPAQAAGMVAVLLRRPDSRPLLLLLVGAAGLSMGVAPSLPVKEGFMDRTGEAGRHRELDREDPPPHHPCCEGGQLWAILSDPYPICDALDG